MFGRENTIKNTKREERYDAVRSNHLREKPTIL